MICASTLIPTNNRNVCNPEAAAKTRSAGCESFFVLQQRIEKHKLQIFYCLGRNNDVPAREFESL
jgi:hypothetical protein